jgi:hypothetical protein
MVQQVLPGTRLKGMQSKSFLAWISAVPSGSALLFWKNHFSNCNQVAARVGRRHEEPPVKSVRRKVKRH